MTARAPGPAAAEKDEAIAIVGMAAIFPGARDRAAFWRNILDGVDAVAEAPPDWHGELFLDPESRGNDRVYTTRGGFLRDLARFDPLRHGVMPSAVDGGEPDQFLALEVAADAVADAGFDQRPVPGDRVAVILGRGTYINRGFTNVVQHGVMVDRFLDILRRLHPETEEGELAEVKRQLKASLPPFNAEIAPALVPNLVSGRISNRLDFRGANYIIDAACASSLIALERGVADLRAGRCDMALVGGVHASTPAPIYQIFCQLEALSPAGRIRPFSAEADGTLLGEGVGILCIKRVSDAEAAGDRIYALVRGVGVASDGRGLGILAPRQEGEALALEHAYAESGVDPRSVGLIEAHGTATKVGDATEVAALSARFGRRRGAAPSCALGAVKSMIGHCLPASGAAGLIKTALALHHRTLPPTLVDTPNPDLGIEETPFYLNTEARPWIHGAATPRRAGVNAFGFGGINAHAVLEEYAGTAEPTPALSRASEALVLDGADAEALSARIADLREALSAPDVALSDLAREVNAGLGSGGWRAGVVAADADDAAAKLARIAERIANGKTRLRDRKGAYLGAEPLAEQGRFALMFPGEGSQHVGMLRELMLHFPCMRRWFDLVDGAFAGHARGLLPSQAIFPPPGVATEGKALWRMDIGPEAIFAANQAVAELYAHLGIRADMMVGHSTGEYSALHASGVTRRDDPALLQSEIRALNDAYEAMTREGLIAGGALVALGAVPAEALKERIAGRDDLFLAMDNCPNQLVVAATTANARDRIEQLAGELGGIAEVLPFERAYHSPAFEGFSARLHAFLGGLEMAVPETPVYSCLTAAPFPPDPEEIRRLTANQWSARVRFTETVRRMHEDGARLFLECGPRNNLTAFVADILRGQPHLAMAVDTPARGGLEQLHHFAAQIAVEGVELNLSRIAAPAPAPAAADGPRRPQVLKMGIQPMTLSAPPARGPHRARQRAAPEDGRAASHGGAAVETPAVGAPAPDSAMPAPRPAGAEAVVASYFDTMERFVSAERDIMTAYYGAAGTATPQPTATTSERLVMLSAPRTAPDGRSLSARVEIDAARAPYLDDHAFGRDISALDPDLGGLAVVPLTFSMEALAEAAAALRPDLVVTGLREVRASRWLALDGAALSFEATAEIVEAGDPAVIRTRLREAEGPALRPAVIEAEVIMASARPAAPPAPVMHHGARREALWTRQAVYSRIMFHGPRLQAVENMDVVAEDGAEGVLRGMARDALLADTRAPAFETDAITLDAVGQLVGVWSAEMLTEAFHIFPFRVERVEIFRPPLVPDEAARCRCRIALVGTDEMRSDIDVVGSDGHLQCRIEGWWDKRFALPERFFRARLDPAGNGLSCRIALPDDLPEGVVVAAVDDIPADLLDGSGGIWAGVMAGLVLSRSERAEWRALAGAAASRRWDWLRGRAAAKDAVRALTDRDIRPADIEIAAPEGDGPPAIGPSWPEAWGPRPLVSIAHAGGIALGAAADPARHGGVGIDIERVRAHDTAFLTTAFSAAERGIIEAASADTRAHLITRMWCAKEAAAKAFGVGLGAFDRFQLDAEALARGVHVVQERSGGARMAVAMVSEIAPGFVAAVALRRPAAG